jgi:cell division protein DivIC
MFRGNPFQSLLKKLPTYMQNRFAITLALFGIWMLVFDKHDLLTQIKLQRSMSKLKEDKKFYKQKIEEVKADQLDVQMNKEKYAREKYYMSRSNEDVFIIEEEKGE